jgi:hypothetical protein
MTIKANKIFTGLAGGGAEFTIITSDDLDYIIVTDDETIATYTSIDSFWSGDAPLDEAAVTITNQ